jgi:sugar lactone lactonase YvrE
MRVDSDGSIHVAADEVFCPNGMAITPDGKTLLVSQSTVQDLLAFDIDQHGNLSNRRVYTTLPEGATYDGMCLDAEGAIWVASPTSNEFLRMREGGEVADRIDSGKNLAIACMLGGPDRRTLFCLSSEAHLIEVTRLGQSRIDVITVDCPGAGWS